MEDGIFVEVDWWGVLLYGVPFIIVVGWFGGRILGVRRGWVRALLSGFVGWLSGLIITAVVLDEDITPTEQLWDVLLPTFLFGLLVSMFVSLVLDVILKPRRRRRRRWGTILHPIATIKRRLSPLGRSREIVGYARKRGLTGLRSATPSRLATPDAARRLRLMLEDCGGMFVKFGQIASTRTDLLPEVLTTELSNLQSSARPVSAEEIRVVLERELGASLDEEFASFDFEPLAAASIGQTHRAVLRSGENVVVKIQRPGIEDIVQRDAAVLRMVAGQVERRVEAARVLGVRRLAEELIISLQKELDYGAEARNGTAFVENLDIEKGVTAPTVVEALSTRHVLVMQAIDGVTVADREAVEATPVAAPELAVHLLRSFLDQVLRDGVYHADPHPGNIFVDRNGTLWLLDFGAVGRLDPLILESMQGLMIGFQLRDPVILARAIRQMAGGDETTDSRALEADIGLVLTETIGAGGFDPQSMSTILDIMGRHGLAIPAPMSTLSRAMLTLEGTLRIIDPAFDVARAATDLMPDFADQKQAAVQQQLQRELLRALPSLRTLPGHVEAIACQMRTGHLNIRQERFAGGDRAVVSGWVDRVTFAAIGAFGLLTSAVLLLASGTVEEEGIRATLQLLGFVGLISGLVIQMRTIAQLLRGDHESTRDRRV